MKGCPWKQAQLWYKSLYPIDDVEANEEVEPVDNPPWADSDRDYAYEEVRAAMLTPLEG